MATFSNDHLAFFFGILGNFISCLVYLAPLVTFYDIYKRRSTQNYHAIPYSVALFSAMLMLYYAHLKGNNTFMLVTINSFGCAIEVAYLLMFFTFANYKARMETARLIIVFNTGTYMFFIVIVTMVSPPQRLKVVGWICATFSICVYAAPLSVMRRVIKTKSVEFMPFPLSFCLTQSAIIWFCYGMFIHDYFVAAPNIPGFLFGAAQIILYFIYRKGPRRDQEISTTQPSEMRDNVVNGANETVVHDLYLVVTEEILEFVETMKNRTENGTHNDQLEEAELPPRQDELHENGVITGNNTVSIVHDDIQLKDIGEENIVEIPESSTVIDVDQGASLEPNVDNV